LFFGIPPDLILQVLAGDNYRCWGSPEKSLGVDT
jgi:hypothetical protein